MNNRPPLIGISVNISLPGDEKRSFSKTAKVHYVQDAYCRFVEIGGGVPILLAPPEDPALVPRIASALNGLIITGGVDMDPAFYRESNTNSQDINPERDRFEIALIEAAKKDDRAVLGICRGIQVLNTAYGGTLIQDIATAIPASLKHHRWEDGAESFHQTSVTADSKLGQLFGLGEIRVNSSHHQSVKEPGKGLQVISVAPDGVVESVVSADDRCVLGVQWHPERMLDDPLQVAMARWFLNQCR